MSKRVQLYDSVIADAVLCIVQGEEWLTPLRATQNSVGYHRTFMKRAKGNVYDSGASTQKQGMRDAWNVNGCAPGL